MLISKLRFCNQMWVQRTRCLHSTSGLFAAWEDPGSEGQKSEVQLQQQEQQQQLCNAFRGRIKEWMETVPEKIFTPRIRQRRMKKDSESESNDAGVEDSESEAKDGTEEPEMYGFYESADRINAIPFAILAPKDEIYQKLSEGGVVSSRLKKPLPVLKLVKRTDAEIVNWYHSLGREFLEYFRICDNLSEVKAIVEYHVRWSAIRTLAKKYRCNEREIVAKYGRDLQCEDNKGRKAALLSREEIKQVKRGVNKKVQVTDRFRALRVLANMD